MSFYTTVTMLTLTTYQGSKSRFNDGSYSRKILGRDLTILDCFVLLKESRTKFLNVLRNRYPGLERRSAPAEAAARRFTLSVDKL